MIDEARTRRQKPGGLGVEEGGGFMTWPVAGQQDPREAGVGEQEFAPLVHQVAANREGILVRRPSGERADEDTGISEPPLIRTADGIEIPRPSDQVGIVGFVSGGEPFGVYALGVEEGIQLGGGPRRHPGAVPDGRVPEKRQAALQALPPGPVARPVRDYEMPVRVPPIGSAGAIDPRGRFLETTLGPGGEGISRGTFDPGRP